MAQVRAMTESASIRERLGHPVVDADGHVVELVQPFADYLRDHGRGDLADRAPFKVPDSGPRSAPSVEERRRLRLLPGFWATPGDTEYFATVTTPALFHERLGEAGIDFAVLYPTIGLNIGHLADDEHRVSIARLFNEYMAEQYGPHADRFTVAAVIPMSTPAEAVAAMEHAKGLGAKVALIPSYVRRPNPGEPWPPVDPGSDKRPPAMASAGWIDTYGVDSPHDYDRVWAKAIELGFPLAAHSTTMGFTERSSVSNFMYNHMGHFAASGEALAKSLFFGGVTRRFPQLRVALLEGGVAVGVRLYVDLVGRWHKRGRHAIGLLDPANIDREQLGRLLVEHDPSLVRYDPDELVSVWAQTLLGDELDTLDDFAAAGIDRVEDVRDRFCPNFYWGCEGDDPLVGTAFDPRITPLGARVPAMFGSDIGHWDVPVFDTPLAEAYELVEHGILDDDVFRDYVFTNAVRCYGSLNPRFFAGTAVEAEANAALADADG
jgi:predicted TIM-barrel fold metal-dependent hydrolase